MSSFASGPFDFIQKAASLKEDFNLFVEASEILENFAGCRLEESAFDIAKICINEPSDCAFAKLSKNL